MKYFIDTEFIEGFNKPIFGKRRHFIDLISIAIVAEDGRVYSAISNEYDFRLIKQNKWVYTNVLLPLYTNTVHGDRRNYWDVDSFHKNYGKSNLQIAQEIIQFVCEKEQADVSIGIFGERIVNSIKSKVDFYADYADYDWVVFCSLFGTMDKLPNGFPMYCRDLKQMLDNKAEQLQCAYIANGGAISFDEAIAEIRAMPEYPQNNNEHNAVSDAKYGKALYHFLKELNITPL